MTNFFIRFFVHLFHFVVVIFIVIIKRVQNGAIFSITILLSCLSRHITSLLLHKLMAFLQSEFIFVGSFLSTAF